MPPRRRLARALALAGSRAALAALLDEPELRSRPLLLDEGSSLGARLRPAARY